MPFVLLRLLWRSRREPRYRQNLAQRFGFISFVPSASPLIWVHAVSAGETIAAVPLIRNLLAGGYRIVLTAMTPTGRERAEALLGDSVIHCYAPFDLPGAVKRFIKNTGPRCLVIIDTELWPNTIHQCALNNIKTILVNGRLSARSANGYGKIPWLVRPMLNEMDYLAVQTKAHGERFIQLGLAREKLLVAGSIKFDHQLPEDFDSRVTLLRNKIGQRFVIIAASTHAGEEEMILKALADLQRQNRELLLVLAPRHSHRCDEVSALVGQVFSGKTALVKHSDGIKCDSDTIVLLLDTMGELIYFYGVSDIAIVGGSLVPVGGHNLMEAAEAGVPIIMGHHLENIDDIASMFRDNDAMKVVHDAAELKLELGALVQSSQQRDQLSAMATKVLLANQGALAKVERLITELLGRE